MKQHQFKTHSEYLRAQRRLTKKKITNDPNQHFVSSEVIDFILEKTPPGDEYFERKGLCHGVRNGVELALFSNKAPPNWVWIGSEIYQPLCDGNLVVCHDFNKPKDEWFGKFHLIYSNSLDHARDPQSTAKIWMDQLRPSGQCWIEWTQWHNKLGARGNRADCFAGTVEEYCALFEPVSASIQTYELQTQHPRKPKEKVQRVLICCTPL